MYEGCREMMKWHVKCASLPFSKSKRICKIIQRERGRVRDKREREKRERETKSGVGAQDPGGLAGWEGKKAKFRFLSLSLPVPTCHLVRE